MATPVLPPTAAYEAGLHRRLLANNLNRTPAKLQTAVRLLRPYGSSVKVALRRLCVILEPAVEEVGQTKGLPPVPDSERR